MDGYAPPNPAPDAQRPPHSDPDPVRVRVFYDPAVGYRRVVLLDDDVELDISGSIQRIRVVDLDPRGPSTVTFELKANVDEVDWVYQTVGVLGDPMLAVDREQLAAVIQAAIIGSGFAESAHQSATTAALGYLRAVFGEGG